MFTRRQVIAGGVGAAVAAAMPRAWARHARGAASVSQLPPNYVGVNIDPLTFYTPEQPLLNIIKMAGADGAYSNDGLCAQWLTSKSGTNDTGEEAYLAPTLDADGWPTTLTVSGIPGGQQFTYLQSPLFTNISDTLPPGASEPYPGGSGVTYQMQVQGAFTLTLTNVSNLTVVSGSMTVSGTTLTSTLASGDSGIVTFNMNATVGVVFQITALPSDTNYLKIPYLVDSRYVSNYLAGELVHPYFKAAISGNGGGAFSLLRLMGALFTYQQEYKLTFTADLAESATSGTLASLVVQGSTFTTWPFPTGTRKVVFATGQVVTMSGTFASADVSWDTALSAAVDTSAVGGMAFLSLQSGWSGRALLSNAFWSGPAGFPAEAYLQICNELGIDCWTCLPAAANYIDSTWATSLAQLAYNGTGANITNSNLSSFSGLNASQKLHVEYSNECWNFGSGYQEANFCEMMGVYAGFSVPQGDIYGGLEWYGTQCAGIGDAFYAVYGSEMAARCHVVMMNQTSTATGGGIDLMKVAMNSPDWTSAAYTHHIGAYGVAPYFGPTAAGAGYSGMNSTDAATIVALSDPLTELYSLAYTNVGASGNTYSSVPTTGYLGAQLAEMQSYLSALASQPWGSLPVECYEGGLDIGNYTGDASLTPYLTQMLQDERSNYLFYDPTHQLSAAGTGYLPGLQAAGVAFVNILGVAGTQWGTMQLITQMASTPPYTDVPRYAGILEYAQA